MFQKANDLAKAIGCEKGELNATNSIMMFYFNTYDYKKALEISNRAKELAISQKDYETLSSLCSRRGASYDDLGMYDESLKEHEAAAKYVQLIADPDKRHYQASLVYYNMTPYYQDRSNEKVLYYLEKKQGRGFTNK